MQFSIWVDKIHLYTREQVFLTGKQEAFGCLSFLASTFQFEDTQAYPQSDK